MKLQAGLSALEDAMEDGFEDFKVRMNQLLIEITKPSFFFIFELIIVCIVLLGNRESVQIQISPI